MLLKKGPDASLSANAQPLKVRNGVVALDAFTPWMKAANPLSRFDFGLFVALTHAHQWQAKERYARETL
jgi:hypothetical protein